MPILNYTTQISYHKTLSEIQSILTKAGATKIMTDNENMRPVSVSFCINWSGQLVAFLMPCNFKGVLAAMKRNTKVPRNKCTEEQALRVGWRILKDWIEAQLAIVDADMVTIVEVFMPYAITKNGQTMYRNLQDNKQLLLTN